MVELIFCALNVNVAMLTSLIATTVFVVGSHLLLPMEDIGNVTFGSNEEGTQQPGTIQDISPLK